jgi:hypothetical protein
MAFVSIMSLSSRKGLVRFEISIDDFLSDLLGKGGDSWRRQESHPADLGVKFDPGGNPRLLVLQRVGVALCRCLDEFLVELLPAQCVLRQPLRAHLDSVGDPGGKSRGEPADRRS